MPPLIRQRIRVACRFAPAHAAIAIAEHEHVLELEILASASQFAQSQFGHGRVLAAQRFGHVTNFAIRRAYQKNFYAVINPFRYRRAQTEAFVVRMRITDQ